MKRLLCVLMMFGTTITYAQVAGDEDKEMFNQARQRDEQAIAQAKNGWWKAAAQSRDTRLQWWRESRFGMFIHWGIYSLPAGEWNGKPVNGYAEHLMRKEKLSRAAYLKLAHEFNPVNFNAEKWILEAKEAGMGYFIITAKHHDGFAMFDSKVSDFDIIDQTPFKRDPMQELAVAAKKHGMKFGFYYSHAFDWEDPNAPGNDWEYQNPGGDRLLGGANWFDQHPDWLPRIRKYVDEKAIPQLKELILNYHPDILWFDTPHKLPLSENLRILQAIRETDSNVVVNGRLARTASGNFGDYQNTGDRPVELRTVDGDAEAIPTTNESYGYAKHDLSHKPASFFIRLLANAASRGSNLLLNIGPKGDGTFDDKDDLILRNISSWMRVNGAAIIGTTASTLPIPAWGVITQRGQQLYLHVFNWPKNGKLLLGGLKTKVNRAYLMEDPIQKLAVRSLGGSDLEISVPAAASEIVDRVIVLETQGPILTDTLRRLDATQVNRLLAFDAKLEGKGFSYGDGKADRYYVEGWKTVGQQLSWELKVLKPGKYKFVARYIAPESAGGTYQLQIGNFNQEINVINQKNSAMSQEIGIAELKPGYNKLQLKAINISGTELMKPLEIQIIPVE